MATESLPRDVDAHIVTLLTKLSALKENTGEPVPARRVPMSIEARSLELWGAVAIECFATFLFSFVVFGATECANPILSVLTTAIASGFAIAAIYLIFGHVSGGHVNPAVSFSFMLSRKISPLRAGLYLAAQCGGGIAGAAVLYGVTNNGTTTQIMSSSGRFGGPIERLLVEMALSTLVVLAHLASDSSKNLPASITARPAAVLAAAYTAATLVSSPFLNPARALGWAFLKNRWDSHWVYWVGPASGGALAALIHQYVLLPKRARDARDMDDGDNSSMRSDEDTYDDLDKPTGPKFPGGYATYRSVAGASSSLYSPAPTALDRVEAIYGGTKSLHCKSPPLTRANLNRSQSVYSKSTSGPRDAFMVPKPGPLVPAQSLYPMRLGQNTLPSLTTRELLQPTQIPPPPGPGPHGQQTQSQNHNSTNQNMQNQLAQCTQTIYAGIRGMSTSVSTRDNGIYGVTTGNGNYGRAPAPPPSSQNLQSGSQGGQQGAQGPIGPHQQKQQQQQQRQQQQQQQQQQQHPNGPLATSPESGQNPRRPESTYGHIARSDDSSYSSYQGSTRGNYSKAPGPPSWAPGPVQQNQNQQSNFQRNSPNPPY